MLCVKSNPALLREILGYDPDTGVLTWLPRSTEWFSEGWHTAAHSQAKWNARYAGRTAFTSKNDNGYLHSTIKGADFTAHRVIFALMAGRWPDGIVDHINGERTDNRWVNLREVNATESSLNQKVRSDNRVGVTGVSWHVAAGKWSANFTAYGKRQYLGVFDSEQDAIQARRDAEAKSAVRQFLRGQAT